jgi:ribosomal protein S18 acetylase RimI-like enzyme
MQRLSLAAPCVPAVLQDSAARQRQDVSVLELRRYEERDRARVWRLHEDGLRQMNAYAGHGPWDDDLRSIVATYLNGGGEFLVGVVEGEVVAIGGLRRVSESVAEVKRMRVDLRFQGRGFGRTVLRGLEERARELGYSTLRLDTTASQVPAQNLYRSAGYREVGRTRVAGLETILFERQLRMHGFADPEGGPAAPP